jgi:hypothetical protein
MNKESKVLIKSFFLGNIRAKKNIREYLDHKKSNMYTISSLVCYF